MTMFRTIFPPTLLRHVTRPSPSRLLTRPLSTPTPLLKAAHNLPPRPAPPPESDIEEKFLCGSGPGGQKINKTASAVQLKHLPTGLVVKSQATRSRSQNRTIARRLLADKLDDMVRGGDSRSAVVGDFKRKKRASSAKKSRRKYRKLDEAKKTADGAGAGAGGGEGVEMEYEFEEGVDEVIVNDGLAGQAKEISQEKATPSAKIELK